MKPPCPSEHVEQVAFFQWLDRQPNKTLRSVTFSIPNGGARNIVVAKKLKAEGVRAGVPDVFVGIPTLRYDGLFLEFKRRQGGQVSKEQRAMHEALIIQGYQVLVVKGWEEAVRAVVDYLEDA